MEEFDLQRLVAFNGKGGSKAYIAYQGKVYDVSDSPSWIEGSHLDMHEAGKDVTEDMAAAPHDDTLLADLPQVGVLRAT